MTHQSYLHALILSLLLTLLPAAAWAQTAADDAQDCHSTAFAWGADLGMGIDIGGHDMSDVNINAYFGMKNRYFHLLGIGAGINMVMGNDCRFFPVYGIVRTSFGVPNARCFADFRGGVAFDNVGDGYHGARTYLAPGLGFNLATGKTYKSYLILSYIYNDLQYPGDNPDIGRVRGLNYASVSIGVTF